VARRSSGAWGPARSIWSGSTSPGPRSIRPVRSARRWSAFASNPQYVAQLWLFIVAPLIGAGVAGILYREGAFFDAKES
jgi:glycerol uptake facilitator-like aquaporin